MRWAVLALLGGCSFQPGQLTGGGDDAPGDAMPNDGELDPDTPPPNGHVRRIDVMGSQVVAGPHVDFPLLVALDASWLRDEANAGDVARADGFDIYFAADAGGSTRLAFEVERYSPTNGELTAWVKIPSLSSTTSLYIHYGDDAITTSQAQPAQVWSGGYEMVLHLGPVSDSTGKNGPFAGSSSGTPAAQIENGLLFNGSSDRIDGKSAAVIDDLFAGGGTAQGWAYPSTYGENGFGRLFDKGHTNGWSFAVNNGNATNTTAFVHGGSSFGEWNGPSNAVSTNAWHHLVVTYDSASDQNDPTFYVDGVQLASVADYQSPTGPMDSDASFDLSIGNREALDRTFNGMLDELRLSSVIRSASWVTTEYRNQANPAAFYTVSAPL